MQSSCQVLQTIIELAESGLIFPVPSFIQTLLIAAKNVKQIIRTIGLCIFPIAKLVNHFPGCIKYFHTHRGFSFDTVVSQHILFQSRFLQVSQISERHSTKLEHQGSNSLCTTQTLRFWVLIQKLMQFDSRQGLLLANIDTGINIMKQSRHIRRNARFYSPVINTTKHTHIRRDRVGFQATLVKILPVAS